jgi:hypothetical protein
MVIAGLVDRDRSPVGIDEADARAGLDPADPSDRNTQPGGERGNGPRGIGRRSKQQFVIVASGREAQAHSGLAAHYG